MMIQRTRSGGSAKVAAIDGSAMFTIESSDTTNAPAAGSHRCTRSSWHDTAFAAPAVRAGGPPPAGLAPHLPPGAGSVGTMVEMKHLAATPVGMTVRARATLLETDGKRFLFGVEAWDDRDKVAEGRHERVLALDIQKLVARAMKK